VLDLTGFIQDATAPGYPVPGGDPYVTAGAPFAVATGHHAAPGLVSALSSPQAWPWTTGVVPYGGTPFPIRKPPIVDRPKLPREDGTYGGHYDY
jgi:hypothetical protein